MPDMQSINLLAKFVESIFFLVVGVVWTFQGFKRHVFERWAVGMMFMAVATLILKVYAPR